MFFISISVYFFYFFYYKNNFLFFSIQNLFLKNFFLFFNKRVYLDYIFNLFLSFFFYKLAYKIFYILDKGIIEFLGPLGISKILFKYSLAVLKSLHSGKIANYLLFIFMIILFHIFFLLFIFSF